MNEEGFLNVFENFFGLCVLVVDLNGKLDRFEGLFELLEILLSLGFSQIQLDEEYIGILRALSAHWIEVGEPGELLNLGYGFVTVVYALLVVIHLEIG